MPIFAAVEPPSKPEVESVVPSEGVASEALSDGVRLGTGLANVMGCTVSTGVRLGLAAADGVACAGPMVGVKLGDVIFGTVVSVRVREGLATTALLTVAVAPPAEAPFAWNANNTTTVRLAKNPAAVEPFLFRSR